MATKDDTSKTELDRSLLEETIEKHRKQLLQAHGVLVCLYEVLLYAEGEDAVTYAEAAHAAATLIDHSVEGLDRVRIQPMIEALRQGAAYSYGVREPTVRYQVKEGAPAYSYS